MKSLCAVIAAALVLPSVGCQSMGSMGGLNTSSQPSHVTRSQMAPRPNIQRAAYSQSQGIAAQMPETGLFQRCSCDCGSACGSCNGGCCGSGGCCGNGGCGCCNGNGVINKAVGHMLDCTQTDASYNFAPGPSAAQTAYPYYSVRGPRDFLMKNPPSIGPGGYSPNCPY